MSAKKIIFMAVPVALTLAAGIITVVRKRKKARA